MFRLMALIVGAMLVSGCATQFYDSKKAGPMLEQASRLSPSSLRAHSSCQVAFAPTGAAKADFAPGACAYTDTALHLYSWDAAKKQYRREIQLEFASLQGVAKAKIALYTQLQIPVEGGHIVFEPKPVDGVLSFMLKAGVKELPAGEYIMINAAPQPQTIYIPVYVGG